MAYGCQFPSQPMSSHMFPIVGQRLRLRNKNAAMDAMISLNRFALYDRLGIRRPTSTIEERKQNKNLMRLLRGNNTVWLNYGEATATAQASNPPHPEWAEQPE